MKSSKLNDKVSIITPVYNSAPYIGECIESVLSQTHQNFEMIIVDDCSTDSTLNVVESYQRKNDRIKIIRLLQNAGPAVARNKGIELASGRYMTFLDGDDIWMPNMIQTSIETIKNKNCPFVFASYKRYDENLEPLLTDFIVPGQVTYEDILKSNSISCLTAFIDTHVLGKKMMPLIRKRQDMGLWLSYLKELDYAVGIKESLAIYRIRKGSLSRDKKKLIKYQWQFYTKVEKLGFLKSIYYMCHWMYRGFFKYQN